MFVSPSAIHRILNAVRNKLIDYLVEIDIENIEDFNNNAKEAVFPEELIIKLPQDVKLLADDFNFNFANNRPKTCMLILRRILPLSIVRRFQKDNKENEIKDENNDYFQAKALLEKARDLLSQPRIYSEVVPYKILTDGAQHSYTLNMHMTDVKGAAITMRVFLDDIFL